MFCNEFCPCIQRSFSPGQNVTRTGHLLVLVLCLSQTVFQKVFLGGLVKVLFKLALQILHKHPHSACATTTRCILDAIASGRDIKMVAVCLYGTPSTRVNKSKVIN